MSVCSFGSIATLCFFALVGSRILAKLYVVLRTVDDKDVCTLAVCECVSVSVITHTHTLSLMLLCFCDFAFAGSAKTRGARSPRTSSSLISTTPTSRTRCMCVHACVRASVRVCLLR